jgi:cellulose synthase operon protein C
MARLTDQLGDLLSRVELLARGAEWQRQEAVRALGQNRPWEARDHALAILAELPRSRVALALWADAAEAMLLDNEAVEALTELAAAVPFRADVWLRLAQAESRLGADPRGALERASEALEPVAAADSARLWLADCDLRQRDPERAERWLEQLSLGARSSPDALLRRVEVALELGDVARGRELATGLPLPATLDARGWLVRGRLLFEQQPERELPALERALMLDAPGAGRVIAALLATAENRVFVERFARLVEELKLSEHPLWRAAFALADGRTHQAVRAIADAARRDPSPELVERYVALALEARDPAALADAIVLSADRVEPAIAALGRALDASDLRSRLAALDAASGGAEPWASELRRAAYDGWLPTDGGAAWRELLAEVAHLARGLGALEPLQRAETVAQDLERPLRVAVVGEFNAGKSSFINALLGEPVAPVGVLPTTATLNRLVWAPDSFVRIELAGTDDRLVPHADLGRALAEVDTTRVERVTIYAPLEPLRRLEIIDTPGFNAPDQRHAQSARSAFDDAHVALWLLDATQPLKASERAVLSEIAARGLPLLVLLNKLDRLQASAPELAQAELGETLAHVRDGLAAAGLAPLAPPLAFSAKLALAGRSADPALLERSRWAEVEALVEHVLVEQSARLRERVLRRRVTDIVERLAQTAIEQASAVRIEAERLEQRAEQLREAARRTRAERGRLVRRLEQLASERMDELASDLRPVVGDAADPAARRFVSRRLRVALGREMTRRAVALATQDVDARGALAEAFGPRAEAVCAALAPWLVFETDPGRRSVVREELASHLLGELELAAEQAARIARPAPSSPLELRARQLLSALLARDKSQRARRP